MSLFGVDGIIAEPTEGNDIFTLVGDNQTVDLLGGNDQLTVSGSGNTVNGDAGNDELIDDGSGTGNTLDGGAGNDTLKGGTGGTLDGGTGRDVIYASPNGSGGNTISGGTGRDIFIIATGEIPTTPNTITDFQVGLDVIGVSLTPAVTEPAQLTFTEDGGNTTISFDGADIAIVNGTVTEANVIILESGAPLAPLPNTAPTIFTSGNFQYDDTIAVGTEVGTFTFGDVDQDELIITGNNSDLFTIAFNANDALSGSGTGTITIAEGANLDLFTPEARFTLNITVTDSIADPVSTSIDILGAEARTFNLDVDNNGSALALSDGILIIRYLLGQATGGLEEDSLAALGNNAQRTDLAALNEFIGNALNDLDVDNNGSALALSDGILIIRYLLGQATGGLEEDSLAALGNNAQRTDLTELNTYIASLMPQNQIV
jgi:hypothetical protein